jgi:hypothetical protein
VRFLDTRKRYGVAKGDDGIMTPTQTREEMLKIDNFIWKWNLPR